MPEDYRRSVLVLGFKNKGDMLTRCRWGLPDRRVRGRPKRRFVDVVKEDMMLVGVREEDAGDRVRGGVREVFREKE